MTKPKTETSLTLFDGIDAKHLEEAVKALISGKTPRAEIKEVKVRGGRLVPSVNAYYMTRQIGLLTGFRWSSEELGDRWWPNEENPVEYEVKVRVTIYDQNGNAYSHTSTGRGDPAFHSDKDGNILSRVNIKKSGYTDGIKKCLSYFGIANDVYGRKDLSEDFFESSEEEAGEIDFGGDESQKAFMKHLDKRGVLPSKACEVLGVASVKDILDYKLAKEQIDNWKDNKQEEVANA